MTTSPSKSLRVGHRVFGAALAPDQTYGAIHLLLIAVEHRDEVPHDQKILHFQLAL